jgi:dipeptidyl aminopeptidase/acylaminoacyl peptidase
MRAIRLPRTVCGLIALLLIGLAGCNLTAPPTATPVPPTSPPATSPAQQLAAAWVDGGNLLVWQTGDEYARRIAAGTVIRPLISPDGQRVAFTRGPQGNALALWVTDVTGVAAQELAGPPDLTIDIDASQFTRQIGQVAWLDASTILFNTLIVPAGPNPGGGKADDLWRVDLLDGSVRRLLPDGQGGDFAISPDGTYLALVTPGRYGQTPGQIRLTTAQGEAEATLLSFEAVSTASEYAFYPDLHWRPDSSELLTAIPDPDLVYPPAAGDSPRTAALWRLGVDGSAAQIGAVPAAFFGLPQWSPEGEWLTYLQQIGDPADNTLGLMLADGSGGSAEQLATGQAGAISPPRWSDAGYTYTLGSPGEVWLSAPGFAARRFPAAGEPVYHLQWAGVNTAAYASAPGAPCEIRVVNLNDPTPAVIGTINTGGAPIFDVYQP